MFRFLFCTLFFYSISFSLQAQNADIDILKSINKKETAFKNSYLELCASSTSIISIVAPFGVMAQGFIQKDKKIQRDGYFMLGGLIATGIVTYTYKKVADRNRPFETYDFIIKRDDESGGKSMPSGHTTEAFYTATALSIQYKKWYVVVPAYIYASSVGWARMYQGVHYPSDVLVGAALGTGMAFLTTWVNKKTAKKITKPVSVE